MLKLHLGCAGDKRSGYINIDINPDCSPDLIADSGALPYEAGSVDEILSNHMLEHMTETAGLSALKHWFSLLRSGGALELEVPDFKQTCLEFATMSQEELEARYPALRGIAYYRHVGRARNIYGGGVNQWDYHRWGYWPEYMEYLLRDIGFSNIDIKPGTSYHSKEEPCMWVRAVK